MQTFWICNITKFDLQPEELEQFIFTVQDECTAGSQRTMPMSIYLLQSIYCYLLMCLFVLNRIGSVHSKAGLKSEPGNYLKMIFQNSEQKLKTVFWAAWVLLDCVDISPWRGTIFHGFMQAYLMSVLTSLKSTYKLEDNHNKLLSVCDLGPQFCIKIRPQVDALHLRDCPLGQSVNAMWM